MAPSARSREASAVGAEALGWIRAEVERSLESARQRLDAFAEDPAQRSLLAEFIARIHELAGVFRIAEIDGPALLAEHIEALARAVEAGKQPSDAARLEPLMRACLELGDHFDRLAAGIPDAPAQVVPTVNELRALLDEAPLARERIGPPAPPRESEVDLAALAARLAPDFQAALLDYYRRDDARVALARMGDVLGELERAATRPAVFEFLWVAGGLVEALADEGLRPTLAAKRLLGHVEREIKRLAARSEAAVAERPPQVLLDELLAQIARAHSAGERVVAIRESFGSDRTADEAPRAGNSALLRSVGGAILEDLGRVRDRIDIFMRTGRRDAAALAPLGTTLKKIADALAMLGLGEAQARVVRGRDGILALAEGGTHDDQAMLRLATELIGIESEVESVIAGSGGDSASAAARAARAAGLREVLAEFARIKDTVSEHLREGGRGGAVVGVPARADRLALTLDFLELPGPAALTRRIAAYLERMAAASAGVARNALDRLADALVSVEYYLEMLQVGREPRSSMLENADRALAALGVGPEAGSVEARPQLAQAVEPAPASAASAPAAAAPVGALPPVREEGADPAIVAVFLEEAGEVAAVLQDAYPRWRADQSDRDALITVRRSFHTLKGSGRMVGARLLGEFAWGVERLLNRVLDHTLVPGGDVVGLVGEAVAALPGLLAQFRDGGEPDSDVARLMTEADRLGRGAAPPEPEPAAAREVPEAPVGVPGEAAAREEMPVPAAPAAAGAARPIPRLAPALYEIYAAETQDHLALLRAWTDAVAREEQNEITTELLRAVHTLKGSARMAGVAETNAIMEPLEEALERARAAGEEASRLAADVAPAAAAAAAVLEAYGDGSHALPDWRPVRERICALRDALPASPGLETEALEAAQRAEVEPAPAAAPAAEEAPREVLELAALESLDTELLQVFTGEAMELLEGADASLRAWRENREAAEALHDLLRRLHTLKGGARMAGIAPFADLVHEFESLLTLVSQGRLPVTAERIAVAERALDALHRMLEHVSGDGRIPLESALVAVLRRDTGGGELPAAEGAEPAAPEPAAPVAPAFAVAAADTRVEEAARARVLQRRRGLTRVRADLLESSINNAGEVGIFRGRVEQQLVNMGVHLAELERTVERVRSQLRELDIETEAQILSSHQQQQTERREDFDPLEFDRYTRIHELSRSLAEGVSDLISLRSLFAASLHQATEALERQGRVNAELQDALLRTRMMPFSLSEGRLRRIVRQVAEETGKQVDFRLTGVEGEMDRQVLDHVLPALEHLLRNSVVHGIEDADTRRHRGKPDIGRIELLLRREGADTIVEVADDGGGLDLAAIRARAEEAGFLEPGAAAGEDELIGFIFRPGFSTAGALSQSAGRGVGMDVVAAEARHVGGGVEVASRPFEGTRVTIRFPAMLAITNALVVRAGGKRVPLPLASIAGVTQISRQTLDAALADDDAVYEYGGESYELVSLARAVGEEPLAVGEDVVRVPLLLAHAGERRVAFVADHMEGNREIVVKPVGPQIGSIPGIAGATIFGDGAIGLLVDLAGLVRAMPRTAGAAEARARRAALRGGAQPLVLVVDDSITVRRVTERMLDRHGVRVLTARDGLEALELLEDHTPDLVLLDIEMPRMDGYELAEKMRADARLRAVPIIIITSRAGDKHRARAAEIGVERYLGKPYQESELLAAIREVSGGFGAPGELAARE